MLACYSSVAFSTASGLALAPGATIEVRRVDTGALAALYSDEAGTLGMANPFTADAVTGAFQFYVQGILRGYQVKSTFGAEVKILPNQAVGTAAQLDAGTKGAAILATVDLPGLYAAMNLIPNWTNFERLQRRSRLFAANFMV